MVSCTPLHMCTRLIQTHTMQTQVLEEASVACASLQAGGSDEEVNTRVTQCAQSESLLCIHHRLRQAGKET